MHRRGPITARRGAPHLGFQRDARPAGAGDSAGSLSLSGSATLDRVSAPISRMLFEVLKAAVVSGSLKVTDTQRAALLIQQTVMYGWLMNRFVPNPRARVTAEDAWEFCLHGLGG